jgi:alpha-1,6-mannosyltransferase
VAATTIFRCDLLLLLFTCGLTWLIRGDLSISRALHIGVATGTFCLAVIVPYDSHMWQRWVWAEGQVFYYNTVLGKSKDWGVSSWHWYVSSALPKALLMTLLLIPVGVLRLPELLFHHASGTKSKRRPPLVDASLIQFLLPILGFIGLYSCLGHKEMRFIFPAIPILNLVGAAGMARLHVMAFPAKEKSTTLGITSLMWLSGVVCMGLTLAASMIFVLVSQRNYPGGHALNMLSSQLTSTEHHTKVYIDNAAAMSGVSLFGQRHIQNYFPNVEFVKAGYEHQTQDYSAFEYVISEEKIPEMRVVSVSQGFPRLDLRKLGITTTDAIYVNGRVVGQRR